MIGHFCLRRCGCKQQRIYKVSYYWHGLFVVFMCCKFFMVMTFMFNVDGTFFV